MAGDANRFVARNDSIKLAGMLVMALVFVGLGVWVTGTFAQAPKPGREWIGWAAILFFGIAAVFIARRLIEGGVQIVIDRQGILWRQWSDEVIPWAAIRDIRTQGVRRQRFICLYLHDPAAHPRARRNFLGALNPAMGFGDISISATGTDRSYAELQDAMDRHAAAAGLSHAGG